MKLVIAAIALAATSTVCFAQTTPREAVACAAASGLPGILASREASGKISVESALDIQRAGTDEIVDLGSITKTVTAIAMLHLIENSDLALSSTLGDLLTDVPPDKVDITLHQLLTNSSGIVPSTGRDGEMLSRSAFLARVMETPLDADPGVVYSYSNAGFSMLAAIIEVQSGLDYEDYLIEKVIPEGLPLIGYARAYDAERAITSGRGLLTGFQRRAVSDASWGASEPGWNLVGNGGLVATAEGFLSLWAAFLDGEVVDLTLVAQAITPHIDEGEGDTFYGYGLVVQPLADGTNMLWHDGGNEIFSAEWRHLSGTGVTFFSAGRGKAAFDAMDVILSNVHG